MGMDGWMGMEISMSTPSKSTGANNYKSKDWCSGEGGGGGAVEADVPEDQQDLAGAPFLPAMLEQVL